MAGKLNVYGLGSLGVNVDKNPINLEDGELTKSQNAVHDPVGSMGGLRKRRGLVKVNSIAAAGTIRGSMPVPISLAPVQTGPKGTAPSSSTRTLWFGNINTVADASRGWWKSTNAMTSVSADTDGTPAFPASRAKRSTLAAPAVGKWSDNPPAGVQYKNRLYYLADGYTVGTDDPLIRVWDGVEDKALSRLPPITVAGTTTKSKAVMQMCVGGIDGESIFISEFAKGTTVADYKGRVFHLDPESGALTQIGSTFPTSHIPNALCWALGRLWCGTYTGNDNTAESRIYFIRPGIDTDWTLDATSTNSPAIQSLAHFQGLIYAAQEGGTGGEAPLIRVRSITAGTWSTSDTGTAGSHTTYLDLIVFKSNLYASYYSDAAPDVSLIRKFDGSSWSTVHTGSSDTIGAWRFHQHNGVLYALDVFGDEHGFLTTTDGSSWTDKISLFGSTDEFAPIIASIIG